jgi:hypothetical protein
LQCGLPQLSCSVYALFFFFFFGPGASSSRLPRIVYIARVAACQRFRVPHLWAFRKYGSRSILESSRGSVLLCEASVFHLASVFIGIARLNSSDSPQSGLCSYLCQQKVHVWIPLCRMMTLWFHSSFWHVSLHVHWRRSHFPLLVTFRSERPNQSITA